MLNDEFFLKLMFSDFGRGSYKTLFDEFEQAEPGYYKACLTTYKLMKKEITVENLNIEKIKKFHQMIVSGVKNTNYKNDQHLAANFSLDERKFMIPIYGMSLCFRRYVKDNYPFGVYKEYEQKYYRKKISEAEIEDYINKYLKAFKDQINSAKDNNQKEQAIYEFVQNLEFLHPFFDANIRFFCIALYNILRSIIGLKEVILVDPNSFESLLYDEFLKYQPYFEINGQKSWIEEELIDKNIKAIELYEKMTGYSYFFHMLVKGKSCDSFIKSYLNLFKNHTKQRDVFLSKHLETGTLGIHHALTLGRVESVNLWIELLSTSELSEQVKKEVINTVDQNGQTLLHIASEKGYESVVKNLINFGINPEIRDNFKEQAVDCACSDSIRELLSNKKLSSPLAINYIQVEKSKSERAQEIKIN
ncbi:ankyrin repeat domain-containing protein [Thiotrichales bacterium 19S9-12]|nr:ankyrin repeat domain-containing protein [Thiotrichales bacterium 19S9-11]MCF6811677.1 ankyrin repeat domain-containing protein [Thiotrichales bacterium 19S9-12]